MIIYIFLFAILFFVLSLKRLDWSLSLTVFALPAYQVRFLVFGVPSTLLELMILILSGVWIFENKKIIFCNFKNRFKRNLNNDNRVIDYPFAKELLAVLIVSWFAMMIAGFDNASLGIWKAYFFEPVLFFIVFLNILKDDYLGRLEKDKADIKYQNVNIFALKKILWAVLLSSFIISVYAIFQKITGFGIENEFWRNIETRRVSSFFAYPNALGLYLAPFVMILFAWFLELKKVYFLDFKISQIDLKTRFFQIFHLLFLFVTIVLAVLSIYFAKSDGAMIALVFSFLLFFLFLSRIFKIMLITFFLISGIWFFYSFNFQKSNLNFVFENDIYQKIEKKVLFKDLSGEIRKQQWRETWQMLQDGKIFTGVGLANYQSAVASYHQEGIFYNIDDDPDFERKIVIYNDKYRAERWQPVEIYMYPHNIFLNFWVELGLIGMILFVWIMMKFFIIAKKIKSKGNLIIGLACAMFVILVHGLVDVPYFKNDLAMQFWIIIAMLSFLKIKIINKATNSTILFI